MWDWIIWDRFGIGSYGIWVWDRVMWDIGLGLGHMGLGVRLAHAGYRFGLGLMG